MIQTICVTNIKPFQQSPCSRRRWPFFVRPVPRPTQTAKPHRPQLGRTEAGSVSPPRTYDGTMMSIESTQNKYGMPRRWAEQARDGPGSRGCRHRGVRRLITTTRRWNVGDAESCQIDRQTVKVTGHEWCGWRTGRGSERSRAGPGRAVPGRAWFMTIYGLMMKKKRRMQTQ